MSTFCAGDGAGVGKGRTIGGVIFENHLKGRKKAIWISVSNDLKYDAERDLTDIGAHCIEVYPLNKVRQCHRMFERYVTNTVDEEFLFF